MTAAGNWGGNVIKLHISDRFIPCRPHGLVGIFTPAAVLLQSVARSFSASHVRLHLLIIVGGNVAADGPDSFICAVADGCQDASTGADVRKR